MKKALTLVFLIAVLLIVQAKAQTTPKDTTKLSKGMKILVKQLQENTMERIKYNDKLYWLYKDKKGREYILLENKRGVEKKTYITTSKD